MLIVAHKEKIRTKGYEQSKIAALDLDCQVRTINLLDPPSIYTLQRRFITIRGNRQDTRWYFPDFTIQLAYFRCDFSFIRVTPTFACAALIPWKGVSTEMEKIQLWK